MSEKKATKAIVAQRVEEVLRIRLDGAEFHDVREYAREKEREPGSAWELQDGAKPLSDQQLWRYVARSDQLIADNFRSSRKKTLRRHLAQRRNLYAKAVSQGDIRAALAVLQDEAQLEGLYPPKKIAPTNPKGDKPYAALTDEERAAALAALYARLGCSDGGPAAEGPAGGGGSLLGGPAGRANTSGLHPGPLASGPVGESLPEGLTPLFAPERQEPD
jgi:hypothetical protein